ncbi:MAG: ehrA-1, partial [Acidobacteria bacterium]|nr:ehrA-1 [Acidobacteriota bacterium]
RMQYTASSFGRPVLEMVRPLVTPPRATLPTGPFPAPVRLAGGPAERLLLRVYWPAARSLERMSSALKWIQHGRVQYYVLYIAATLVLLLAWKLGR